MAYNKASEERKWRLWKEAEEKQLRELGVSEDRISEYLNDTCLDSRQIYFVNQIVEYIVHNGLMKDLSVLQESPFTDQGSIVEVFTDINVWLGIRTVIESINANACVA